MVCIWLSVPLGDASPDTLASEVDINQTVMDRLVPAFHGLQDQSAERTLMKHSLPSF